MSDLASRRQLTGLAGRINAGHARAGAALRDGVGYARAVGDLLVRAKGRLASGTWLRWLGECIRFSPRTAQGYVQVSRDWARLEARGATGAHVGWREALALLAGGRREGGPPNPLRPPVAAHRQRLADFGAKLAEQEALLPPDQFRAWLAGEFGMGLVEARKYMADARTGPGP